MISNGILLLIRMTDGSEISVAWVDDNGKAIKGKPVISDKGFRLKVADFKDLVLVRNAGK